MRTSYAIDALFSRTVQGILSTILLERAEPWYMSDLAKRLSRTASTLQRPLDALVKAGILKRTTDGNRVYYSADSDCPFLPELKGLLLKTVGLVDILQAELKPVASRIQVAFVYGSLARNDETSQSDVDLFVVGELTLSELAPILKKAEKRLARPVNVSLYPKGEFSAKLAEGNHFLRSVLQGEKLLVIGTERELEKLSEKESRRRPQDKQSRNRRASSRSRKKP